MAIERTLTSEAYQSLPEGDKSLYELSSDGSNYQFVGENVGALKRVKDHEVAKRHTITKELNALRSKLAELESDKEEIDYKRSVQDKDRAEIEKIWQDKMDKALAKEQAKVKDIQEAVRKSHREQIIDQITNEVTVPKFAHFVRPMIEKRIDAEITDQNIPRTIVRDAEGNVTALTSKDFIQELRADKRNADILKDFPTGSGTTKQVKPEELDVKTQQTTKSPFEGLGYKGKLSSQDEIVDAFRKADPASITEFAKYIPEMPADSFDF